MSKNKYKNLIVSIHHTDGPKGGALYFYKGKVLTPAEYGEIMKRKWFIKESIKFAGFVALMIARAWLFLEYGI